VTRVRTLALCVTVIINCSLSSYSSVHISTIIYEFALPASCLAQENRHSRSRAASTSTIRRCGIHRRAVRIQNCVSLIYLINTTLIRGYHLKRNPKTVTFCGTKIKSEAGPPPCRLIDSPSLPRDTRFKVIFVARPLLTPVANKLCRCEHGYSRAEHVFILQHSAYFASKSFAAVRVKNLALRTLTRKYRIRKQYTDW
jgi:hypothetical protein